MRRRRSWSWRKRSRKFQTLRVAWPFKQPGIGVADRTEVYVPPAFQFVPHSKPIAPEMDVLVSAENNESSRGAEHLRGQTRGKVVRFRRVLAIGRAHV